MRALLVTHYFTPTINAASLRWEWLSHELASLGVDITVVGAQDRPFSASQPASERPRPERGRRLSLRRRVVHEVRASLRLVIPSLFGRTPDVVIVTIPPLASLGSAWLLAKTRRVPLVLDLRDAWPEILSTWREWGDLGIPGRHQQTPPPLLVEVGLSLVTRVSRWMEKSADLVITTSEAHSEYLRGRGFRRVITIRNSAGPLAALNPDRGMHRELRVLYIGTVGRSQQLSTAVRAAAKLNGRTPITLRIVGAGVHFEELRKLARELDAPVEFVERVPRAEVREQYDWCDTALIMLRNWPIFDLTVPSKLYEAMAYGRHLSASVDGEAARIVAETQCGDVVPAGDVDALARLWARLAADRSLLQKASTAKDWLAEHTDRKTQAADLFGALRQVIRD